MPRSPKSRWRPCLSRIAQYMLLVAMLPWQVLSLGVRGKKIYNKLISHLTTLESCFYVDRRYSSSLGKRFDGSSFIECQQRCQAVEECQFFTFWNQTSICLLGGADSVFEDDDVATGAVAGPKVCPARPAACAELPDGSFPGATPAESQLAWPSHRVPEKLECWPKNSSGGFYNSCPTVTVLEDSAGKWPLNCEGLKRVLVPYKETCESFCRRTPKCSIWQLTAEKYPKCYQGRFSAGRNCFMAKTADAARPAHVARSQRLLHGEVRVLLDLTGVEIVGLSQAFDQNYFINVSTDAVRACRNVCYSNIACEYWLYSKARGCFVEDVREGWVDFPLTTGAFLNETDFAKTVIAGEYIQHVCTRRGADGVILPDDAVTYTTTEGPDTTTQTLSATATSTTTSTTWAVPPAFAVVSDQHSVREASAAVGGQGTVLDISDGWLATGGLIAAGAVLYFGLRQFLPVGNKRKSKRSRELEDFSESEADSLDGDARQLLPAAVKEDGAHCFDVSPAAMAAPVAGLAQAGQMVVAPQMRWPAWTVAPVQASYATMAMVAGVPAVRSLPQQLPSTGPFARPTEPVAALPPPRPPPPREPLAVLPPLVPQPPPPPAAADLFDAIDLNRDGVITREEFERSALAGRLR